MAITYPSRRVTEWRPRSLRFAHWRDDGGHVAFAEDVHRKVGHDAVDRYALMLHLARYYPDIELELDGARLRGRLDAPGDDGRTPFHPPHFADGTIPRPTRGIGWLRWTDGKTRHLAECAVASAGDDERWMLSIPRAVESDDRRLLPRTALPGGWRLEPAPSAPQPLRGVHGVRDLSLVGAAILVNDLLVPDMVVGRTFVGTLHMPSQPPQRLQSTVRNLRQVDGGAVLGLAIHGAGFAGLRLLDEIIAKLR